MSSEQTPTQTPRVEISSLQNTAIEAATAHEEFPKTPLNSPQNVIVPGDDNISEHNIASPIDPEKSKEETKESKSELFHEGWFKQNELALLISLAHLIAARNKAARKSGGEQAIFGKNIFIPDSDSKSSDLAKLYFYYNEVCLKAMNYISENYFGGLAKYKHLPNLPTGYQQANTEEDRHPLSQANFSQLVESSDDNPWKSLDVGKIFGRANDSYERILENEMEQDHMNPACFRRISHFCNNSICRQDNKDLIEAMKALEYSKSLTNYGLEELSEPDPKVHDATNSFKSIKHHVEKGAKALEKHMADSREKEHDDRAQLRKVYTGVENGEQVLQLFPGLVRPETKESAWMPGVYRYIRNKYTLQKFFYDLHIIMAANADDAKNNLPPIFPYFWGSKLAQRKSSATFIKESVTARQSELLMRAGWAPFDFTSQVYLFIFRFLKDKLDLHWDHIRNRSLSTMRPHDNAITGQVIDYLGWHLLWYSKIRPNLKPMDPDWVWQLKIAPRSEEDNETMGPCELMWRNYQKEVKMDICLDFYMPPEFRAAKTEEDQKALTGSWIKEVIQLIADHFFSKQGWKFSMSALENYLQDTVIPEERQQYRIKQAVDAEKAHQRIMTCSTIQFITSATKEDLALIPVRLFCQDKDKQVAFSAIKYLEREKDRLNPLIARALTLLLAAEGNFGPPGFRNSSSPAIRLAAKIAVEKDGLRLIPLDSSLLCECDDEEQHKLQLIDDVARGMCETITNDEELKKDSKMGFAKLGFKVLKIVDTKE
ncbi:hypothetical protein BDZ45DRAFT_764268 [Acephala macrosclerotiorum]|nr:hypothetical protein BDZ45DRAFT_764268 [Acephala macrosclerotiorum]